MLAIDINSNVAQLSRMASELERRQVAFATSRAINSTAFDVRKQEVEKAWPTAFDVRNTRFIGTALRVEKSTKHDLTAVVFDRFGREFVARQARGGVKHPAGRHIAIPTSDLAKRRGTRGVPKNLQPRQALRNGKTFVQTVRGQKMILRRTGKGRKPLQPLYLLEVRATVRKAFPFRETAIQVVRETFAGHFLREFERAVATAKR